MGRWVWYGLLALLLAAVGYWWWQQHRPPAMAAGWTAAAPLPGPRGEAGVAALREHVVVVGGIAAPGRASDRVDAYDPETDVWFQLPPLPEPLHHAAVVAVGERVYVFGGSTGVLRFRPRSAAYVYSLLGNAWERLPDMPGARLGAGAAAVGDQIYVVGGEGLRDEMLETLSPRLHTLVFHTRTRQWSTAPPLPRNREHLAVVAWEGRVLAIGGRAGSRNVGDVHMYTPGAATWETRAAMPTPRSGMAAAVAGGKVHVIGGEDPRFFGGRTFATHEVLDPTTGYWERRPDAPSARHGMGAAVLGGRLYVAGGATAQGTLSAATFTGRNEALDLTAAP